jgi:hypothetical protein
MEAVDFHLNEIITPNTSRSTDTNLILRTENLLPKILKFNPLQNVGSQPKIYPFLNSAKLLVGDKVISGYGLSAGGGRKTPTIW